jgi:hypothetical protein
MSDILKIASAFQLDGKPVSHVPYGTGHIHDTYLVTCDGAEIPPQYIVQRINTYVFKWPEIIMNNIFRIAEHLKGKVTDPAGGMLIPKPISTWQGGYFTTDPSGSLFRCFSFIPGTISVDKVEEPQLAFEAASMFGRFVYELRDLSPQEIGITIPDFHNLGKRYEAFREAIEHGLPERKQKAAPEVEALDGYTRLVTHYDHLVVEGGLPERVCHKDTKINNVLIDQHTLKAVCVIDLDTVMPGSILSDFGDMVRTFTNNADEDEPDTDKVFCRLHIFEALAKGFLSETSPMLENVETNNLVFGAKYLTCMQAVRFLTDYLNGDVYYKTRYEGHNLVRTKNQLKLLRSIEEQEEEMNMIVRRYAGQNA